MTLGQYLRPTREHEPVDRYVPPEAFARLEREARALGFPTVYPGVFVRSSFNAEEVFRRGVRRAERRRCAREGLAALSGLLLVLSFPKFGHGAVAWVALAPAARGPRRARGLARGAARLPDRGRVGARPPVLDGARRRPVRRPARCRSASLVMVALCLAFALFPLLFGWATGRLVAALRAAGAPRRALPLGGAPSPARRTPSSSSPGACSATASTPLLPLIQIASVDGGLRRLVPARGRARRCSPTRVVEPRAGGRRAALAALAPAGGGLGARQPGRCRRPVAETGRITRRPGPGRHPAGGQVGCRRTPGATSAGTSS